MTNTRTLHEKSVSVPPVSALSSGLIDGDTVYVTGQMAFDVGSGGIAPGANAARQTEIIMARIETLLRSQDMNLMDLVKVTIFVTDPATIMEVNGVYTKWVKEPYPARSTIGVAFLALPDAKVEIEAVARRGH